MGTNGDTLFTPEEVAHQLMELAHIDGEITDSENLYIRNFCSQYQLKYDTIHDYYKSIERDVWREVEFIGISRAKGLDFEKVIVDALIKDTQNLLEWRGDKAIKRNEIRIQAQSDFNPDLRIKYDGDEKQVIYNVECKWRAKFCAEDNNKKCFFIERQQLSRYKSYGTQKGEKVFLAIGIGNKPHNPEYIYFIDIEDIEKGDNTQNIENPYTSEPSLMFELKKEFKFTLDQLSNSRFIERFYNTTISFHPSPLQQKVL